MMRGGLLVLALLGASWIAAVAQVPPPSPFRSFPGVQPLPAAPPVSIPALPGTISRLTLSASFAGDGKTLRTGLVWRVFAERGPGIAPELVTRSEEATPSASLEAGSYVVHVAYGLASAQRRVELGAAPLSERLELAAGALKIAGAIGDAPIAPDRLVLSIFVPLANDSEGRLIASNVRAGELVRLPEGAYHVRSTYGESNAIMRADLKVETGRVTEATLNHRAATVTLKLVAAAGGEAFAGTAFSVLTPGGDVIREAIGAFPTVTLAEGDYVLIARQSGKVYTRDFKVESGLDRDIEVVVDRL